MEAWYWFVLFFKSLVFPEFFGSIVGFIIYTSMMWGYGYVTGYLKCKSDLKPTIKKKY